MNRLGPFEPQPFVAVAVSGGADSMAAAVLTADWARSQGGDVLALVIDHGLRAASGAEVTLTCQRLAEASIASFSMILHGLRPGPGIAERARIARHAALEQQCARRGILHLVFGHHAGDQAETVMMRMLAQSGAAGLAGMASLVETSHIRRLRPLLEAPPAMLREVLRTRGIDWVEDPSNVDPSQLRARLRMGRSDPEGRGAMTRGYAASSAARGRVRAEADHAIAGVLARRVAWYPGGFARLSPGPIEASALACVLATIAGAERRPSQARLEGLAQEPHPTTIAGVRILSAGRLGAGWLLVREPAAMQGPVAARPGVRWDGRFRLTRRLDADIGGEGSLTLGAWGMDAVGPRSGPPMAVLQTLPTVRRGGVVMMDWHALCAAPEPFILYDPPIPAAGAPFFPLIQTLL